VLQGKAAAATVQRAGHLFDGDIGDRAWNRRTRGQHPAFADRLQAAGKALVQPHPDQAAGRVRLGRAIGLEPHFERAGDVRRGGNVRLRQKQGGNGRTDRKTAHFRLLLGSKSGPD
jgi:hypothetical protein